MPGEKEQKKLLLPLKKLLLPPNKLISTAESMLTDNLLQTFGMKPRRRKLMITKVDTMEVKESTMEVKESNMEVITVKINAVRITKVIMMASTTVDGATVIEITRKEDAAQSLSSCSSSLPDTITTFTSSRSPFKTRSSLIKPTAISTRTSHLETPVPLKPSSTKNSMADTARKSARRFSRSNSRLRKLPLQFNLNTREYQW